jgi:CRISPR-associated protein Cmr1
MQYGRAVPLDLDVLRPFTRNLSACFDQEWPHAIGRDERGLLLWRTKPDFGSWSDAMKELARVKIDFRTCLQLSFGGPQVRVGPRHILAYPVTNHTVREWEQGGENTFRLANQLYFKVVRVAHNATTRYLGLAAHFPHRLPEPMLDSDRASPALKKMIRDHELRIWQTVHRRLDECMTRWK